MSEQRSSARVWLDRAHYLTSACTLALLIWLFNTVHTGDKNDAVFQETLLNVNNSITQLNTRVTVLETIRIEIAKSHYTKPEVESLVDRSIRPLQRDIVRLENSVTARLDKIYDEVKK